MKKFSILVIILAFVAIFLYTHFKTSFYNVLNVISPIEIVVDLNNNGTFDDGENIVLKDVFSFSSKLSDDELKLAKKLNISSEDVAALGYFVENFASEILIDKKVKVKFLKNKSPQIIVDGKSYEKLLLDSGLALKNGKIINNENFNKKIKLSHYLRLRIYNNKSHKYHKLDCKYGQMAHDYIIMSENQLPDNAKPCGFCMKKHKKYIKKSRKIKEEILNTVISDGGIEVFLTDFTKVFKPNNSCSTRICKEFVNQINSSKTSIDMAIYGYGTVDNVEKALLNAQKRGVKIRIVYDTNSKGENIYPDTLHLIKYFPNSVNDRNPIYKNAFMHNKFFVFDNKKVITGSLNLSPTDFSEFNSNAIVLINSVDIAKVYSDKFEKMYNGEFHNTKFVKNITTYKIGDANVTPLFSPVNKPITSALIPLINNAHSYIYIPTFLITHKDMAQALISAKHRGVKVLIILDATNSHMPYSMHKKLRASGILVKTENVAGKMHAKSMIIDDRYTIIGSMNFSKSGENKNDENLVIIENSKIAKFYRKFFEYQWNYFPSFTLKTDVRSEGKFSKGSCSDGIDNNFDGKIDKFDIGCQ